MKLMKILLFFRDLGNKKNQESRANSQEQRQKSKDNLASKKITYKN